MASQRVPEISSVIGHPPSLVRDYFSSRRVVVKPYQHGEGHRPSPQRPQYPNLYRLLKRRLGCSLGAGLYKRSLVRRVKKLHMNVLELKAVSLALKRFKDQCQNQTVLVATDNSTAVAYINKQGKTHLAEICALPGKIMTWCHHYQITGFPGCLNVMAGSLSRSTQVQSTQWSLHPQVFKQICQKWFFSNIDLFTTPLNHKLPMYISPVPDQHAWDALNIPWSGLDAAQCRDPAPVISVNNTSHNSPTIKCSTKVHNI